MTLARRPLALRSRTMAASAIVLAAVLSLYPGAVWAKVQNSDVHVDERVMRLACVGTPQAGQPTVIAEAGLGGTSADFLEVLLLFEEASIPACAYDRAGLGHSEHRSEPSDLADGAHDLHALLEAASVEPPYILLPHSLGAWYARYFTDRYPGEVVGIVFVDPTHPDTDARFHAMLPPPSADETLAIESIQARLVADPSLDDQAMAIQVHSVRDLGDRPVVVLTQDWMTVPMGLPAPYEDRLAEAWLAMAMEQASLSTHGVQRVVPGSTHFIQVDHPIAVVQAVQEVLAAMDAKHHPS